MDAASAPSAAPADRLVATRTIAATPDAVWALLADPTRHRETEPGDWVREALDPAPITAVGQTFAVAMHLDRLGGDYTMVNRVTEFEPGRTIAWAPGMLGRSGRVGEGGHIWRYDLEPADDGRATLVTLTYDWTGMPQATRDWMPSGMPPFGPDFLDASLSALARACTNLC